MKSERRTPILKALKEEPVSTCWVLGAGCAGRAGPTRSLVGKGKVLLWGYKYSSLCASASSRQGWEVGHFLIYPNFKSAPYPAPRSAPA